MNLAQGRYQWRAFVNTVMNLWVALNERDFLNGQEVVVLRRIVLVEFCGTA